MLKRFTQGAKAMGGSALTGARATTASMGRGFDTVTSSRPVVSTAVALKKQTIDLKMKTGTLISILFLLVFYISVSALAINIINKCSGAKDSQKLQNMKGYFSHTLAMAIGVVVTLFTIQLFTAELSAFYVIFSLMGAVGSYMLINIINECDPSDKTGKVTYAGISAAVNTLMLIGCGFMLFKGKKTIQKSLQGPATMNGVGPEYLG